jgi:predicted nuclease of predicted toxin-antitoxin system
MARLYTNENMDYAVVEILRNLQHDVLTAKDAGKANQGIPDEDVLAFAKSENRIVVTFNYQDFKHLHRHSPQHSGIVICTEDRDATALALRIHAAIESAKGDLENQLVRVIRPNLSPKKS